MAELMLADNTHTSVVMRAIGVQDGRPYDKNYAYPNRFTLVRCPINDVLSLSFCSLSLSALCKLQAECHTVTATRCGLAASFPADVQARGLCGNEPPRAPAGLQPHLPGCDRNACQPAADAGRPAPQQSR